MAKTNIIAGLDVGSGKLTAVAAAHEPWRALGCSYGRHKGTTDGSYIRWSFCQCTAVVTAA